MEHNAWMNFRVALSRWIEASLSFLSFLIGRCLFVVDAHWATDSGRFDAFDGACVGKVYRKGSVTGFGKQVDLYTRRISRHCPLFRRLG